MNETIFTKQSGQKQLNVTREFNGPLELVWKTWTDSDLLDKWWAPKPWKTETKFIDFSEGGYWLYSMNGPEGEQHWARADYKEIAIKEFFKAQDSFCDEEGNKNSEMPEMFWHVNFSKTESGTKVEVDISFSSEADMERIIETGFKEGFTAAHENLDELLKELSS
ncbi:MAG TPA: SRPBCC domain-containing protein [Balneolaceae bacterium]